MQALIARMLLQEFREQVIMSPLNMQPGNSQATDGNLQGTICRTQAALALGQQCSPQLVDAIDASSSFFAMAAVPSKENAVGYSAYLLEQAAVSAVQTAVKAYGDVAVSVLNPQRVVYQPAYGSIQTLQRMAQECLQGLQEQQQNQSQQ